MNPFRINFEQLYRRHLCRHGHFGINVLHLLAVAGIYLAVFGVADHILQALTNADDRWPILALLTMPWFITVACNVPVRVTFTTGAFVALLLSLFMALPAIPVWAWVLLILALHRFQQFSHRIYPQSHNMSEYETTYPKGFARFALLLFYELPILLNYLVYGSRDWVAGAPDTDRSPSPKEKRETVM